MICSKDSLQIEYQKTFNKEKQNRRLCLWLGEDFATRASQGLLLSDLKQMSAFFQKGTEPRGGTRWSRESRDFH